MDRLDNLGRFAAECAYEDTEKMVYHTVHRFIRQHGGDFHEALSVAHDCFLKAFQTHRPEQGAFTTWAVVKMWYGLMHAYRVALAGHKHAPLTEDISDRKQAGFDISEFLEDLCADARLAAWLALHPPPGTPDRPASRRRAVREALLQLGWSAARIDAAFARVGEALA